MKIDRPSVGVDIEQIFEEQHEYKLVRERDQHINYAHEIHWIEFDEHGHGKAAHESIKEGYTLLMGPLGRPSFIWQTTLVTEIVEQRDDYIKFKTENSNYELFIS